MSRERWVVAVVAGGVRAGNISQQRQLRRHQVSSDISALLAAPRNVFPSERNILQNKTIKTISLITITIAKHWSKLNIWKVAQNYKIMESTLPQVRNVLNKISAIKNLSSLYRGLLLHSDSITDSDGSYIWHSIFSLNTDLVKDTGLLLLPLRIVKHDRFN